MILAVPDVPPRGSVRRYAPPHNRVAHQTSWFPLKEIIALSWDGRRVPAIAAALGCSPKAVRERLARFTADGLDGLGDRPAAGRNPRISQEQRSQLIALVASPPPGRLVRDGAGELVAADAAGPAVWTL